MDTGKRIGIQVNPQVEIDGALVARALALEVDEFRRLMEDRRISVLCERGVGEDEGLYRASFYYGERRARMVVDANGTPVAEASS
jgi:hypothetical protein